MTQRISLNRTDGGIRISDGTIYSDSHHITVGSGDEDGFSVSYGFYGGYANLVASTRSGNVSFAIDNDGRYSLTQSVRYRAGNRTGIEEAIAEGKLGEGVTVPNGELRRMCNSILETIRRSGLDTDAAKLEHIQSLVTAFRKRLRP